MTSRRIPRSRTHAKPASRMRSRVCSVRFATGLVDTTSVGVADRPLAGRERRARVFEIPLLRDYILEPVDRALRAGAPARPRRYASPFRSERSVNVTRLPGTIGAE